MTIEDIKDLKDKVYELEGLLELAQLREDKIEELEPLIQARIRSLLDEEEADEKADEEAEIPVSVREEKEPVFAAEADESDKADEPDKAKEANKTKEANKPAFCINDRFRFRRELFNGSESEFAAAMNVVASMENYEEAEDYFLGELGWDPEDANVIDFLAIIEQYFGKA